MKNENNNDCFAFFDLDGTIIKKTSLIEFYKYYLEIEYSEDSTIKVLEFERSVQDSYKKLKDRSLVNAWYYRSYLANMSIEYLKKLGKSWYENSKRKNDFFVKEIVDIIENHKECGHKVVILTGSFREIVAPISEQLAMDFEIVSPLEEKLGKYTGKLTGLPTIEEGKKKALLAFIEKYKICLDNCYGYGDHCSDISFLELVKHPNVVSSCSDDLLDYAKRNKWDVIDVSRSYQGQ